MAYLIICCDGTWNDPNNEDDGVPAPTNVRQLFQCIPEIEGKQLTRYQSGVGTSGGLDKFTGGIFGCGVSEDIRDCYQWLADKYSAGDQIIITGFSRGAFTARSLAGMIGKLGVVKLPKKEPQCWESVVNKVYDEGYRDTDGSAKQLKDEFGFNFHPNSKHIFFLGVWDTVGALGVPDDKTIADVFDNPRRYEFHDVKLSKLVEHARHAVAIDEWRGSFSPTLWEKDSIAAHPDVKQLWFPGVHSDVGGGYKESGLADGALKWMISELKEVAPTLHWVTNLVNQISPNENDVLHDSHVGIMKVLITSPRSIPSFTAQTDQFHKSAIKRFNNPPIKQGEYRKNRPLGSTVDIYAIHPWYWTGIYLEADKSYTFSATGSWNDSSIPCDPDGCDDGKFYLGEIVHVASKAVGWLEGIYKKLTNKKGADFLITRREERSPFFCLMGAIANGGNPKLDGTAAPLKTFEIGKSHTMEVKKSGYLYCFANDAWGFYNNNRGYVSLTVREASN